LPECGFPPGYEWLSAAVKPRAPLLCQWSVLPREEMERGQTRIGQMHADIRTMMFPVRLGLLGVRGNSGNDLFFSVQIRSIRVYPRPIHAKRLNSY
jgi:hypothetical protein